MKRIAFCTSVWNEFNLCCRATKCSQPNSRADRLSLEIHLVWMYHSPYGERVYINVKDFSASANISSLLFPPLYTPPPPPPPLLLTPIAFSVSLQLSFLLWNSHFSPVLLVQRARIQPDAEWTGFSSSRVKSWGGGSTGCTGHKNYCFLVVCLHLSPSSKYGPNLPLWIMMLNNGQKSFFPKHYDLSVKLTFGLFTQHAEPLENLWSSLLSWSTMFLTS